MKQTEKTILIYGLAPMQILQLNALAQPLGIRVVAVTDSMTACRIDDLLAGKPTLGLPAIPLLGRFALLAGFDGQEGLAIPLINRAAPGVIKAVRTETNGRWRFVDLAAEIGEEHRVMNGRK